MHDAEAMTRYYRDAETSFLLEGLDSSKDEEYQAMKARVISGEISFDEAIRLTVEHYRKLAPASVRELSVAR